MNNVRVIINKTAFLAHGLAVTVCRLFALEAYISINRMYCLSIYVQSSNRRSLFSSSLSLSSRCAFVQPGPRLSTNTPTFFSNHSRCTKRVPPFLSLPTCKPCETTVWQQILSVAPCLSSQLLLLVTGHAFRILSIPTGSREEYGSHQCRRHLASTQSRTKRLLEHDLKKENEHAAHNSPQMSVPHRGQTRREAEHMPTRAQEQFKVAISQFDCAVMEIERAQPEIHALDEE